MSGPGVRSPDVALCVVPADVTGISSAQTRGPPPRQSHSETVSTMRGRPVLPGAQEDIPTRQMEPVLLPREKGLADKLSEVDSV